MGWRMGRLRYPHPITRPAGSGCSGELPAPALMVRFAHQSAGRPRHGKGTAASTQGKEETEGRWEEQGAFRLQTGAAGLRLRHHELDPEEVVALVSRAQRSAKRCTADPGPYQTPHLERS